MRLNIVIPSYNEEQRLPKTLNALADFRKMFVQRGIEFRVYIVNDGSKDRTAQVASVLIEQLQLPAKILEYGENRGKGGAVKFGMLNSEPADYYYLADADLSADWTQCLVLLDKIDGYDAAIGSRVANGAKVETVFSRKFSGRLSNLLIKLVLGLKYGDTQCGYKLFKHNCLEVFSMQKIERFGFDFEILYLMKKLGLKTKEVGIVWENREGSKVKPIDYLRTLHQLLKVRFGSYNL
ncbi:MAG: glycosyltransferase [Candidatus Dojkabacteria bacterium]